MYAAMGGGREGLEACVALEKLIEVSNLGNIDFLQKCLSALFCGES
jgi:hypothetical protein